MRGNRHSWTDKKLNNEHLLVSISYHCPAGLRLRLPWYYWITGRMLFRVTLMPRGTAYMKAQRPVSACGDRIAVYDNNRHQSNTTNPLPCTGTYTGLELASASVSDPPVSRPVSVSSSSLMTLPALCDPTDRPRPYGGAPLTEPLAGNHGGPALGGGGAEGGAQTRRA